MCLTHPSPALTQSSKAQAQYERAYEFYQQKDYKKAVKWLRKAAKQGHAEAQFNLGVLYSNGDGVKQDDAKAAKWYRKAAEQREGGRKTT